MSIDDKYKIDLLVVGGGGSGGYRSDPNVSVGGGGGGEVIHKTSENILDFINNGKINIKVGEGGNTINGTTQNNGEDSKFGIYTAIGGGAGAGSKQSGYDGGSGGGGSGNIDGQVNNYTGGDSLATIGDGNPGGSGEAMYSPLYKGGGGGGGGALESGGDNEYQYAGHIGGKGIDINITGTTTRYGSGGAGGGITIRTNGSRYVYFARGGDNVDNTGYDTPGDPYYKLVDGWGEYNALSGVDRNIVLNNMKNAMKPGDGGGVPGNGNDAAIVCPGKDGAINSGGGGGGGSGGTNLQGQRAPSGNGGSGIVVFRYRSDNKYIEIEDSTDYDVNTITENGVDYTVYEFKTVGTYDLNVTINSDPTTPENITIQTNESDVTINWTDIQPASIPQEVYNITLTDYDDILIDSISGIPRNTTIASFTGLNPSSIYNVSIDASNEVSTSGSTSIQFYTVVITIIPDRNSVEITWEDINPEGNPQEVYNITIKDLEDTTINSQQNISRGTQTVTFTGLKSATIYKINFTVSNTVGIIQNTEKEFETKSYIFLNNSLIPSNTETYNLGSETNRWKDLYLSGNTLVVGNTSISESDDVFSINKKVKPKKIILGKNNTAIIDYENNCWTCGLNTSGQLGDVSFKNKSEFVNISNLDNNELLELPVSEISIGEDHCLLLDTTGSLYGFGNNLNYKIGIESKNINQSSKPVNINFDAIKNIKIKQIASGKQHNIILDEDNNIWCWGNNEFGQLGSEYYYYEDLKSNSYRNLDNYISNVLVDSGNSENTWFITESNGNYIINSDITGSEISLNLNPKKLPIDIKSIDLNIEYLGSEENNSIGITLDISNPFRNYYYAILSNTSHNSWTGIFNSYNIEAGIQSENWTKLTQGNTEINLQETHNLNLVYDETDNYLKLYIGDEITEYYKINVNLQDINTFGIVSIKNNKSTKWGDIKGKIYIDKKTDIPININSIPDNSLSNNIGNVSKVTCGDNFSVILENGNVWIWGQFDLTEHMATTTTYVTNPINLKSISQHPFENKTIINISSNGDNCLALDSENKIWYWGNNIQNITPINIQCLIDGTEQKIIDISCGYDHYLALDENNRLWCWGINSNGQFGNNQVNSEKQNTPECISLNPNSNLYNINIKNINAGYKNSAVIDSGNNVWVFGKNEYGKLGIDAQVSEIKNPRILKIYKPKISVSKNKKIAINKKNKYVTDIPLSVDIKEKIIQVGTVLIWSTTTDKLPDGFLLCDGTPVSRKFYKNLFDIIGTTYGSGDGINTFNLPNIQERVPILNGGSELNKSIGSVGGNSVINITTNILPSHNHEVNKNTNSKSSHKHWMTTLLNNNQNINRWAEASGGAFGFGHSAVDKWTAYAGSHGHSVSNNVDSSDYTNNVYEEFSIQQPYISLYYIIKF